MRPKVVYVRTKVLHVRQKVICVSEKLYVWRQKLYVRPEKLYVRSELYKCGSHSICAGSIFIYYYCKKCVIYVRIIKVLTGTHTHEDGYGGPFAQKIIPHTYSEI